MSDKITYSELVDLISEATGKPKQFVTDFVTNLVDIINEGLERDGKVRLGGLGIFELHDIPETTGTNPRTGEPIPIAAHTRVAFRAASAIEKHVNRSYAHLPTEVIDKPAGEPEQVEVEEAVEAGEPADVPTAPEEAAAEPEEAAAEPEEAAAEPEETAAEPEEAAAKPEETAAEPEEAAAKPAPVAEPAAATPSASAAKPVQRPKPPVAPRKHSRLGDLMAAAAVLGAALILAYSYYSESLPEFDGMFTGLKESLTVRWAEFRAEDSTSVEPAIAGADSATSRYIYPGSDSMEVTTVAELELGVEPGGVFFTDDEFDDVESSAPLTTHTIPASQPTTTRYQQENAIQHRVGAGDHLWNLAEEHYHEPLFWVHIYGANKARIDNPDSLPPGAIISIPAFDGSPTALTIRDSVNLSMGAFQAYEAYKDRNQEWSAYYLRMSRKYQPAAVMAGAQ